MRASILGSTLALVLAAAPVAAPVAAIAAGSVLNAPIAASDVLHVQVVGWNPVDSQVIEWPALVGDYPVATDGKINVPFAGRISAAGKTTDEIGAAISKALKAALALPQAPYTAVSVTEYRPIVVSGLVRTPGPVKFRPGLTAEFAIGLAGGLADQIQAGNSLQRDLVNAEGQRAVLEQQRQRLLAQIARLKAERDGTPMPPVPELGKGPAAEAIVQDEKALMSARRDQFDRQKQSIDSQIKVLNSQIDALKAKAKGLADQEKLAQDEVKSVQSLSDRGLLASQRLFDAKNSLLAIQNQILDTQTSTLQAQQAIASAQRDQINLTEKRKLDIVQQLQDAQAKLDQVNTQIKTQARLSQSLAVEASKQQPGSDPTKMAEPVITIVRPKADGSGLQTITDVANTVLLPGDMVSVKLQSGGLRDTSAAAMSDTGSAAVLTAPGMGSGQASDNAGTGGAGDAAAAPDQPATTATDPGTTNSGTPSQPGQNKDSAPAAGQETSQATQAPAPATQQDGTQATQQADASAATAQVSGMGNHLPSSAFRPPPSPPRK